MLTDELSRTMHEAIPPLPVEIDVRRILQRADSTRRRRRLSAGGSGIVVIALVVAAAVTFVPSKGSPVPAPSPVPATVTHRYPVGNLGSIPVSQTDAKVPSYRNAAITSKPASANAFVAAYAHWGPTRGSLAHNAAFLAQVRQQWQHPTGPHAIQMQGAERTGPIRVLYAGQTVDGPAAVVAQRTKISFLKLYVGVMTTSGGRGLGLWGPNDRLSNESGEATNAGRFSLSQVSFTTAAGHDLVVLPTDPAADVTMSFGHTTNSQGQAVRTWSAVANNGGVAVTKLPAPSDSWDTLVRTVSASHAPQESPVWINAGRDPEPSNALRSLIQVDNVTGAGSAPEREDTFSPWVRRYGAADEPFGRGPLDVEGALPDGSHLLMTQLWLNSGPAHTVILHLVGNSSSLVSDTVTDPRARPLFAQRLAEFGAWLVVAGPHATVTGYRAPGSTVWIKPPRAVADQSGPTGDTNKYTRAAAFIRTTLPRLQLRLVVEGKQRIVTTR